MKRFLSFLLCIVLLSGAAALAENAAPAAEPKGAAVQKVEITKYYSDGNDEITKKQYQALTENILKGKTVRIY